MAAPYPPVATFGRDEHARVIGDAGHLRRCPASVTAAGKHSAGTGLALGSLVVGERASLGLPTGYAC